MTNRSAYSPVSSGRRLATGLSLSALFLVASAGTALAGDTTVHGIPLVDPIPGVREFSGQIVVKFKPGPKLDITQVVPGVDVVARVPETGEFILRVPAGMNDALYALRLAGTGKFIQSEPDWRVFPLESPNDTMYGSQWHHARMNDPAAWDLTIGSPSITVAIVDSGVDLVQPDLAAVLVGGYNAVTKLTQAAGGDVSDVSTASHGTIVAGCTGAIGNNSVGVAGVGWNLRLMPVRATNEASGSAILSTVLAGCRWAADNGAKVINASFSGVSASSVQNTGAYARDRGAILVWASGNAGTYLGSAADWPDVIIVGATDQADGRPSWGNYGPALDIVAPGVSILSTEKNNRYGAHDGTSFSSPLVAGAIATAWSVYPSLPRQKVIDAVLKSASDLGAYGEDDTYGRGVVSTRDAVLGVWRAAHVYSSPLRSLDQEGPVDPTLWPVHPDADVKTIYFGDELNAAALATNAGDVLESAAIDTSGLDPARAQLRVWTFQAGDAELVVEYLSSEGEWSPMIDSASTISGPHEHAWILPLNALHAGFALRLTNVSGGAEPLYLSNLTIAERCNADFDDTGFVDTDDFSAFVDAFDRGDGRADVDLSGFVDTDDFTQFVLAFSQGC